MRLPRIRYGHHSRHRKTLSAELNRALLWAERYAAEGNINDALNLLWYRWGILYAIGERQEIDTQEHQIHGWGIIEDLQHAQGGLERAWTDVSNPRRDLALNRTSPDPLPEEN